MFQPVIKWSGSKRSQASQIIKYFPQGIHTYYEPFCGGCSVLRALLSSDIKPEHYICSDLNLDLINLWNEIKKNPSQVFYHYASLWRELNKDIDLDRKRSFFESVRERLNKEHNPLDFMFIMRTTTNGMPRYNQRGEFNNSFHITRNGIEPSRLESVIKEWSLCLNKYDVQFVHCSYEEIKPSPSDFMYLDPPYANTKGMYFGNFDVGKFFEWLGKSPCRYVFSFDGIAKDLDQTYDVPESLYSKHVYLDSGNSSFRRVIGKSRDTNVFESLYMR